MKKYIATIVYILGWIFVPYILGHWGAGTMFDSGFIMQWLWGIVVSIGIGFVGLFVFGGAIAIWKFYK